MEEAACADRLIVPSECLRFTELHRPGSDYAADVARDFEMIEPHLPKSVDSILDIGCGMAGIDVLLKRRYPNATLNLLDGEGERPTYGWNETCRPYSSRTAAESLLEANGVKPDRWIDLGTIQRLKAGLVISLLSWGFHYPLSTYRVRGFCIADLRVRREPERGTVIARWQSLSRCAFAL